MFPLRPAELEALRSTQLLPGAMGTACPAVSQSWLLRSAKNPAALRTSVVSESLSSHFFQAESPRATHHQGPVWPPAWGEGASCCPQQDPQACSASAQNPSITGGGAESGSAQAPRRKILPMSQLGSQGQARPPGLLLLCLLFCLQILGAFLISPQA